MYLAFTLALLPFSAVWARNRALFTNVGRVDRVDDGSPAFELKGRFIQVQFLHLLGENAHGLQFICLCS